MAANKLFIMYLEDDISLSETLKDLLIALNPDVEVTQFTNGDDAAKYVQNNCDDIRLFLLDVRVPGSVDGIGVARKIREVGCEGDIVFMSAFPQPDPSVLSRDLKFRWLNKPWNIEDIMEVMETAAT
jgi:DNA-binding response OmpR family regulator